MEVKEKRESEVFPSVLVWQNRLKMAQPSSEKIKMDLLILEAEMKSDALDM